MGGNFFIEKFFEKPFDVRDFCRVDFDFCNVRDVHGGIDGRFSDTQKNFVADFRAGRRRPFHELEAVPLSVLLRSGDADFDDGIGEKFFAVSPFDDGRNFRVAIQNATRTDSDIL